MWTSLPMAMAIFPFTLLTSTANESWDRYIVCKCVEFLVNMTRLLPDV